MFHFYQHECVCVGAAAQTTQQKPPLRLPTLCQENLGGGCEPDLTRKAHRTTLDYHEVVHRNIHIKMLSKLLVVASVGLAAGTQRAAFLVLLLVSTTL